MADRGRPTWLRVRNFAALQHDKNRPDNPWIRFYVRTLDDEELNALPVATRLLFDRLLLLAQRFANAIPNDYERIAKLTCIDQKLTREGLAQLLKGRWIEVTRTPRRVNQTTARSLSQSRAEKKVLKGRTVAKGPARAGARAKSLPIDIEHELDRLMPKLKGIDEMSRTVVEAAAAGLPLSSVAKVRESVERNGGKVGVGYVINALLSERYE